MEWLLLACSVITEAWIRSWFRTSQLRYLSNIVQYEMHGDDSASCYIIHDVYVLLLLPVSVECKCLLSHHDPGQIFVRKQALILMSSPRFPFLFPFIIITFNLVGVCCYTNPIRSSYF